MDWGLEILSKMNIGELLVIAGLFWLFKTHMDKKFENIDKRFEKIESRLTSLEHDIVEMKTILRMKECCFFKETNENKKAE